MRSITARVTMLAKEPLINQRSLVKIIHRKFTLLLVGVCIFIIGVCCGLSLSSYVTMSSLFLPDDAPSHQHLALSVATPRRKRTYNFTQVKQLFPKSLNCGELLHHIPEKVQLQFERIKDMHEVHFQKVVSQEKFIEGHVGQFRAQQRLYAAMAQLPFVRTICEIGFNGGHSTMIWLASNPDTRVFSFDLGHAAYVRKMARYLLEIFPDRLQLILGNSTQTVPIFSQLSNHKCDLIVVDGGHSYNVAKADLENMAALANPSGHLLVYDDYPSHMYTYMDDLGRAWREMEQGGKVMELYNCYNGAAKTAVRGFTVGKYLNRNT